MPANVSNKKVSEKVMEFIRKHFEEVPNNLTAREAIEACYILQSFRRRVCSLQEHC
jgi:hypothetical protein